MKKKDIILIVFVVGFSAILSFFLSGLIVGDPASEPLSVERVEPITSEFNAPSDEFFNEEAVNPTQLIRIGDGGNVSPFSQSEDE